MMKEIIRYERDENKRPVITRCVLYDEDTGKFAMGTSVCSKKDQPVKKVGKAIAMGRARKAFVLLTEKPHGIQKAFMYSGKKKFIKSLASDVGGFFSVLPDSVRGTASRLIAE